MEFPELSLAPTSTNSSSSESETNPCRKRKFHADHNLVNPFDHHHHHHHHHNASVDLQFKDTLPLDWEQCLDLQSGKMYYLNRKTARKTWNWPKDQKLDLELNISTHSNQSEKASNKSCSLGDSENHSSSSNMVALACLNCHLLVILSKSSPSCPNCKYVHSLPSHQNPPPKIKTLSTLSLLN